MSNKTKRSFSQIWADNLNYLLGVSGQTQQEFATRFDDKEDADSYTDGRTLRKYLHGVVPRVDKLIRFARSFNKSVESLFSGALDADVFLTKEKNAWIRLIRLIIQNVLV